MRPFQHLDGTRFTLPYADVQSSAKKSFVFISIYIKQIIYIYIYIEREIVYAFMMKKKKKIRFEYICVV